jgi:hypothetical protein
VSENENKYVGQNVSFFTSTVKMQEAIGLVDKGQIEEARGSLAQEENFIKEAAVKYQTKELKEQILSIHRYKKSLEEYEEKPAEEKKLLQKSIKFEQYEAQKKK